MTQASTVYNILSKLIYTIAIFKRDTKGHSHTKNSDEIKHS